MKIVTDTAADMALDATEREHITIVPQSFTLDGKTYRSGIDIQIDGFYDLLSKTDSFPTTAQPAPGEFAEVYRQLAADDPDIISIHVSEGLSGTINSAREGAKLVPEANVTIIDSGTLSIGTGWQVMAAARAVAEGRPLDEITRMLKLLQDTANVQFTIDVLKYLIHGGRVSHIQGMMANLLDIKPMIGVSKVTGKYEQLGRARTLKKALKKLVDQVPDGIGPIRVQIAHGEAPESVAILESELKSRFDCTFMPTVQIAPVLACHTGPTMAGFGYAPESTFKQLPI
jgi:DegV family protein with EDD domain